MKRSLLASVIAGFTASVAVLAVDRAPAQAPNELRAPSAFSNIANSEARSRAFFTEAARVIMHPRCVNCHPASDRPLQGNDQHIHAPAAARGDGGGGVAGNRCAGCHMDENYTLRETASYRSIPGNPRWGLAPLEMAWEGKSAAEVCAQIKDPKRNGGRDLTLLHEHFAKDELVGWGWKPGAGREPVPGTQEQLAELVQAWIDTGAHCP